MSVYVEHKTCGCGVDGIGTLEHPYKMRLCAEHESAPRLRDLLRTVEERGPDIEAIITEFRLLFDENTKPMTIMYAQQRVRRAYEIALLALARGEESEGGK